MKKIIAFSLLSLLLSGPVSKATPEEQSDSQGVPSSDVSKIAEGCQGCHRGALDLSQNNAAKIAAQIRAMQSDRSLHPSPMPALNNHEVDLLAELLARE